jgi:hypothetical protein
VPSTEVFQRASALAFQMEVPMASSSVKISNPDPHVGEECWKTDLETAGAISLHLVVDRIQLEVVAAMWKVARLLEILSTISWVSNYSENPITCSID